MVRICPLVSPFIVETQFLPRFCELCSESMFHIRKVCATSIGEMCRVVGPELAEEYLLPKFFNLCEDGIWGVRKACTECFMEVSNSLSPMARRNELAQLFVGLLCDQSRWVRMSAFQALGPFISTFADPDMTGLYFDHDGILRVQALANEIISTHKSPGKKSPETSSTLETGIKPADGNRQQIDSGEASQVEIKTAESDTTTTTTTTAAELVTDSSCSSSLEKQSAQQNEPETPEPAAGEPSESMELCSTEKGKEAEGSQLLMSNSAALSPEEVRWNQYTRDTELVYVEGEKESSKLGSEDYGSFQYWREPVPTLDLESILQEVRQSDTTANRGGAATATTKPPSGADTTESLIAALQSKLAVGEQRTAQNASGSSSSGEAVPQSFLFGPGSTPTGSIANMVSGSASVNQTYAMVLASGVQQHPSDASRGHSRNVSADGSSGEDNSLSELIAKQQDIIPPLLLENYLSMTDPSRAQTVDSDIAQHCAYSLPAVAYTLGKENWKCLRSLYHTLVSDMQWKVRRTLAYSIHELAIILGPELTHSDLIPIFDDFIKDLDEVRIGVLSHLADFLKLLNGEARRSYLTKLQEFMKTDNNRIWRPRLDLACQLVKLIGLYRPQDVVDHVVPITMQLLTDRIADVRTATLSLISQILKLLQDPAESRLRLMIINDLIEKLAYSDQWHARQTFVKACHRVLLDHSLGLDQISKELLPSLLALGEDKIPNVRLSMAAFMSQCLISTGYFISAENPHHDDFMKLNAKLKSDPDRDVRYYANLSDQATKETSDTVEV